MPEIEVRSSPLGPTAKAYSDSFGNWRYDILPFLGAATQTGWSTLVAAAGYLNGGYLQSSGTQNDQVGFDVEMSAGTWDFRALFAAYSGSGIITVSIDAVNVGTIDQYVAGGPAGNTPGAITGVVVAASGKKRVLLKLATKNASSSGYYSFLQLLTIQRTA